jgi:hypothetical protein
MIEIASSKQDKFGFYQVGDFKTYSKFDASAVAEKTNQALKWNFNDAVYHSVDWEQEPPESLSELYRKRAQQLREKYDYLVLWFSGGADSTNILDSFLLNNIKLDDVATYVNYEATGDRFNFLNAEIYNVAVPRIDQARELQPWLRHTMVDLSRLVMDHFQKKDTKFDWVYHMNGHFNPNNASKQDIKLKVQHWRDMIDQGKRVCFIHGIDKPRVNNINGKYYFKFIDMIDGAVSAHNQMINRPWEFDELFYWTPDSPAIPIKQAHVIKRFLKQATANDLIIDHRNMCFTTFNKQLYSLRMEKLHLLIYPNWYPVLYQAKAPSLFFTPRDEWFFKLSESEPAKYSWKVGLEYLWRTIPNSLKTDHTDIRWGFKNLFTHYYIGT